MPDRLRSVLLDPIRVGSVTLPSRIVMGSMHTGLECRPKRFEQLGGFYAERAKGGAQILHAGRYGYHPAIVAPSSLKSPLNRWSSLPEGRPRWAAH